MFGNPAVLKLSVSMLTSLPPIKGISTYSVPLLTALGERNDLDIDVVAFSRLYPERFYPGGRQYDDGASLPSIPGVRISSLLDGANPLTWFGKPAFTQGRVVHAQWWSQVLAPAYLSVLTQAKARGRQVVVTMHNVEAHEPSHWKSLADRSILGLADHVVVHTEQNKDTLLERFPVSREKVSVIPMGPQGVLHIHGMTRGMARATLGLPQRPRVVLFFGNIRPYKGLDVLLDAFETIRASLPNALLLVVGQPWSDSGAVANSLDRAKGMDGVKLSLGYIPEDQVEAYFAAADLLVFPYVGFEAQSGAAARAVAFKRAMVVTDVGGLGSLVRDSRAMVPTQDSSSLATAVVRILQAPALLRKLEKDAELVASELAWDKVAEATARLYRSVLVKAGRLRLSPPPRSPSDRLSV
jgi:glycosyltransferase involved in cell wall biosynthesis